MEATLRPGVNATLILTREYGDNVTYVVMNPGFGQDDGWGGNLIIQCVRQGRDGAPGTLVGLAQQDLHAWTGRVSGLSAT